MKNDLSYPSLYFNNARIQRQSVQKHVDVKIKKATKDVNLFCYNVRLFQRFINVFIRPHLDFGDVNAESALLKQQD